MNKVRPAWPLGALVGLALVSACSEARSDIENIDAAELEAEGAALSESADVATKEQVAKIQTFAVKPQSDAVADDNKTPANQ